MARLSAKKDEANKKKVALIHKKDNRVTELLKDQHAKEVTVSQCVVSCIFV